MVSGGGYPKTLKGNPSLIAKWREAEMEYSRITKILVRKDESRVKMRLNHIYFPEYVYILDALWSAIKPYKRDNSQMRQDIQNSMDALLKQADSIKMQSFGKSFFEINPQIISQATNIDTAIMDIRNQLGMGIPTGTTEGMSDEMFENYIRGGK